MPHVILFRTPTADDAYTHTLQAAGYTSASIPAIADRVLTSDLTPILARGAREWEAVIITSRRAGEAWVRAVNELGGRRGRGWGRDGEVEGEGEGEGGRQADAKGQGAEAGEDEGKDWEPWSALKVYSPGPAVGAVLDTLDARLGYFRPAPGETAVNAAGLAPIVLGAPPRDSAARESGAGSGSVSGPRGGMRAGPLPGSGPGARGPDTPTLSAGVRDTHGNTTAHDAAAPTAAANADTNKDTATNTNTNADTDQDTDARYRPYLVLTGDKTLPLLGDALARAGRVAHRVRVYETHEAPTLKGDVRALWGRGGAGDWGEEGGEDGDVRDGRAGRREGGGAREEPSQDESLQRPETDVHWVALFSPSSAGWVMPYLAEGFDVARDTTDTQGGAGGRARGRPMIRVVAIGTTTGDALVRAGWRVDAVAETPDAGGLAEAIRRADGGL